MTGAGRMRPPLLFFDEGARAPVPRVAAIVVRVDDPGVEQDAQRLFRAVRRVVPDASPNPVSASTASARDAVFDTPLANAPAPGGIWRGARVTYAYTAGQ
jgi:hypothetical protein